MKLHASAGYNAFLQVFDANGTRLDQVVAADTETGEVRKLALNTFGEAYIVDGEIQEVWDIFPHPLRVFDTRLGLEITSQSQLDFIERSRAAAHAANLRWERACMRARVAFEDMAWKYGCKLGNPRIIVPTIPS